MSGHSKWSTIKRQKGAQDIRRGQTFTKVANAITIAVKLGGSGDPEANPRLRAALEEARSVNMPKENVQRAIDRGLVPLRQGFVGLEEVVFEGFGPSKVAFLLEGVTDNKLRTLQEIKNLFERSGGSLASQRGVAYMFDRKGELRVSGKGGNSQEEMLELIDLGAEDVEPLDSAQGKNLQEYLVYVESSQLNTMSTKLIQSGYRVEQAEVVFKPNTLIQINDPQTAKKVLEFAGKLEALDDIQKVYANFDIPQDLLS